MCCVHAVHLSSSTDMSRPVTTPSSDTRSSVTSVAIVCYLLCLVASVKGSCFFPTEYQGVYVAQYPTPGPGPSGGPPGFSEVNIVADAIPVWGACLRRVPSPSNSVLLRDRTRNTDCIRCFNVKLRSPNVLQIRTEALEKCYTKAEAAMATCPGDKEQDDSKEIVLYRKPGAESTLQQVYCPINGRFKFSYTWNGENNEKGQCSDSLSEIGNCPYGFSLSAKFRGCSFPDKEVTYQCLGDWDGPNGERFLALLDIKGPPASRSPRYRCAMYREDPATGSVTLSLSPDSTCSYRLRNSSHGYETFSLTPVATPSLPEPPASSTCRFPDWAQGSWQDLEVSGDSITYTDSRNFKSYSMRCLEQENGSKLERFRVYARTQCGDETYNCILLTRRGRLVLEFQMGMYPSLRYNDSLCGDEQFSPRTWITQGTVKSSDESPCPIAGDYSGVIPDTTGLCAKLRSNCANPDRMFYSVSNCANRSEVYEEREYKCLGEWKEEGVMYAYTRRLDLPQYQCFVGQIVSATDVFIKEAGDNCVRGIDPLSFGMKMTKQASGENCEPKAFADMPVSSSATTFGPRHPEDRESLRPITPPSNHLRPSTTSRSWRIVTSEPERKTRTSAAVAHVFQPILLAVSLLLLRSCT